MSPGVRVRQIVLEEVRLFVRATVREALTEHGRKPLAEMPRQTGTYRGDTRAKKAVRLRVWEIVRDVLGERAFSSGPHLFLCSQEGGDASVLRGLGVQDRAMMAVDHDPKAAGLFWQSYPDVPIFVRDVADVVSSGRALASAYLDFTSHISEATLQRVLLAACSTRIGGVVACTFASGREKNVKWDPSGDSCAQRLKTVESYIASHVGYKPQVLARISYSSESVAGPGSNMCVLVFRMVAGNLKPLSMRVRAYDLYRDVYRLRKDPKLHLLLNCSKEETRALVTRVVQYPPSRA